jgi:transcriptional regulator with XRE-family HTH domain
MQAAAKWVQPEHHKIVGATLTAARRRAKLTQVELAARLGKPQSVVSEYENGRRRVDVVEFLLIVRALGADPVEVFAEIAGSLKKRETACGDSVRRALEAGPKPAPG